MVRTNRENADLLLRKGLYYFTHPQQNSHHEPSLLLAKSTKIRVANK
jgi:hypothetical protein